MLRRYIENKFAINTSTFFTTKSLPWIEYNEVFELCDSSKEGYALVIDCRYYSDVALLPLITEKEHEILNTRAYRIKKDLLFNNVEDAKLQMIYIAIKHYVSEEDIEDYTNGIINKNQFIAIKKFIFENLPEKLI